MNQAADSELSMTSLLFSDLDLRLSFMFVLYSVRVIVQSWSSNVSGIAQYFLVCILHLSYFHIFRSPCLFSFLLS